MEKTRWGNTKQKRVLLILSMPTYKQIAKIAKKEKSTVTKIMNEALSAYASAMMDIEKEIKNDIKT